jgi:hypothetical protein
MALSLGELSKLGSVQQSLNGLSHQFKSQTKSLASVQTTITKTLEMGIEAFKAKLSAVGADIINPANNILGLTKGISQIEPPKELIESLPNSPVTETARQLFRGHKPPRLTPENLASQSLTESVPDSILSRVPLPSQVTNTDGLNSPDSRSQPLPKISIGGIELQL